jgi:ATP adenylyltransferase
MDRLWAPWRIEYVAVAQPEGCIFCAKPAENRDEENLILHRSGLSFIILNAFPYNNGHLMVAPYRHVGDLDDLSDEEALEVVRLVTLGKKTLTAAFRPDGFNIGVNLGRTGGAGIVDHVHVHVVPRWDGDTNFMPVTAGTKVMPQALERTYQALRQAMAERNSDSGGI